MIKPKHRIVINEWLTSNTTEIQIDGVRLQNDGRFTSNCIEEILSVLGIPAEVTYNIKIEKCEIQTIKQRLVRDVQ